MVKSVTNNNNQQQSATSAPSGSQSTMVPMVIIGGLFFMFGFVTWLNGSLIPFLQIACELNNTQAYLVTMAFYIAYVVTAIPMSMILNRVGYKNGMVWGLIIMVIGALLFVPAAMTRMYSVFLLALFVLGTGLTILQTASNPYIVMIGPNETAAVRISVMGVLNKSAGVIAPIVFTALVLSGMSSFDEAKLALLSESERAAELADLSSRLIQPYLIMAGMLGLLAVFLKLSPLTEPTFSTASTEADKISKVLSHPQLVLGAITLFFYVGAEVIAGDTIGLFGKELGAENFGQLTSYTMAFMVSGYIIGMIVIPRLLSQKSALAISAVLGLVFCLLLLNADTSTTTIWPALFAWTGVPEIPDAVVYVALFGLSNALVWPAVWPLSLKGLSERQTNAGSALLIMSIAGGAILPLVYGAHADSSGDLQGAYWIMIPCYVFILFFAVKGHELRSWRKSTD